MLSKRIPGLLFGLLLLTAATIGGVHWWNAPTPLICIDASEVSRIEIFNGSTGQATTITDRGEIERIIDDLNAVSMTRERISLGYLGFGLRTTIYRIDGTAYREFIINSSDTIRDDPFFYRVNGELIDYDYILQLVD